MHVTGDGRSAMSDLRHSSHCFKSVRLSARRSDPPMDSANHGVLQNEIFVADIVGINPNHIEDCTLYLRSRFW